MRPIKFRAWDRVEKEMVSVNILNWSYPSGLEVNGSNVSLPSTLMQYTGLKDTNDKEIYEGDITKGGIIEFKFGKWIVVNKKDDLQSYLLYDAIHDSAEQEVIGNIYENPELIK